MPDSSIPGTTLYYTQQVLPGTRKQELFASNMTTALSSFYSPAPVGLAGLFFDRLPCHAAARQSLTFYCPSAPCEDGLPGLRFS